MLALTRPLFFLGWFVSHFVNRIIVFFGLLCLYVHWQSYRIKFFLYFPNTFQNSGDRFQSACFVIFYFKFKLPCSLIWLHIYMFCYNFSVHYIVLFTVFIKLKLFKADNCQRHCWKRKKINSIHNTTQKIKDWAKWTPYSWHPSCSLCE